MNVHNLSNNPKNAGSPSYTDSGDKTWARTGMPFDPSAFAASLKPYVKGAFLLLDDEKPPLYSGADLPARLAILHQQLDIVAATRSDLKVGIFPAFHEQYDPNWQALAAFDPDLDAMHPDANYIRGMLPSWSAFNEGLRAQNDAMASVWARCPYQVGRLYFPDITPDQGPIERVRYVRAFLIRWTVDELYRLARGRREIMPILCGRTAGRLAQSDANEGYIAIRKQLDSLSVPRVGYWDGDGAQESATRLGKILAAKKV